MRSALFSLGLFTSSALAGACAMIEITQPDDGSQTQTASDDRHVRSPATRIRGDCFHVIEIELSDRRWQ